MLKTMPGTLHTRWVRMIKTAPCRAEFFNFAFSFFPCLDCIFITFLYGAEFLRHWWLGSHCYILLNKAESSYAWLTYSVPFLIQSVPEESCLGFQHIFVQYSKKTPILTSVRHPPLCLKPNNPVWSLRLLFTIPTGSYSFAAGNAWWMRIGELAIKTNDY